MRVYIAGPMTNRPGFNYPAFDAARDRLRAQGYEPVSPADISRRLDAEARVATGELPRAVYIQADMEALATCDAIHILDGWQESQGAREELEVAIRSEMAFIGREGLVAILPSRERRERLGMGRDGRILVAAVGCAEE